MSLKFIGNGAKMRVIKGDLLALAEQGNFDIIVQGCNCFTTMGAGIARQIRESYPGAYNVDAETVNGDTTKLGTYTHYDTGKFIIINAYTQYLYNRRGECHDVFEYEHFDTILNKLAEQWPNSRFGFPKIGCGLAGGDESRILSMIDNFNNIITKTGGTATVVEYGR